jgi:glycosyltransferase involved in cell wall biosynthesis
MIIYATNIHTGGGKVLLDEVLRGDAFGRCTAAFVDERYAIPAGAVCGAVIRVAPGLLTRWRSEWHLRRLSRANPSEEILCFGNLPPLLRMPARTILFLQNAFLLPGIPAPRDSIKVFLRIVYEKAWFRAFVRNADRILVQTRWMRDRLPPALREKTDIQVVLPRLPAPRGAGPKKHLFVAVTGNERHKRLHVFIDALRRLDLKHHRVAIVTSGRCGYSIAGLQSNVDLYDGLSRDEVLGLYETSRCLVMTSDIESFCLPLYEARHYGLDVIATDQGFVTEALTPTITVSPVTPDTLAAALQRYIECSEQVAEDNVAG